LLERASVKGLEILFITFNFTITRVEVLNSKKTNMDKYTLMSSNNGKNI
jgi:hypothetical protein